MSALTRWERGAYVLSALLVLSSLIVLPVVRVVDPVLAVALNYAGDSSVAYRSLRIEVGRSSAEELEGTTDPWGRPWHRLADGRPYSVGADGVDALGAGDDVTRDDVYEHPLRGWTPREVFRWPRLVLATAGLMLALWTLVTHETLRAPRARLALEVRRAAFIALAPGTWGGTWVVGAGVPGLDDRFATSGAGGFVQLPASIVIPLSWALLCYLPALAWRLTRPREAALS